MSTVSSPFLLIGIGNEYRGDDGAGLAICRELKRRALAGASVIACASDGAVLLEMLKTANRVILIDAVSSGARAGTIYRFDALAEHIPLRFSFQSTHSLGVAEAVGLARTLDQLPPYLIVYAIEGKNFTTGVGLSPEVEEAAQQVVELVIREVQDTP